MPKQYTSCTVLFEARGITEKEQPITGTQVFPQFATKYFIKNKISRILNREFRNLTLHLYHENKIEGCSKIYVSTAQSSFFLNSEASAEIYIIIIIIQMAPMHIYDSTFCVT